jgi:hypothetical protein
MLVNATTLAEVQWTSSPAAPADIPSAYFALDVQAAYRAAGIAVPHVAQGEFDTTSHQPRRRAAQSRPKGGEPCMQTQRRPRRP